MNLIKLVLVFFVLCMCFTLFKPSIDTFYQQNESLPFKEEYIDDKLYMCKDSNDLPFSCHGQGVTQSVYDKHTYSAPCPHNWLLPGNSIYS